MPNGNLSVNVVCPCCGQSREARGDVVRKAQREGRELHCKPCRNRTRFENRDHPRKGKGVKNDPVLKRTRESYYKAKQRCRLGDKHHPAYRLVEFRFTSFEQFLAEIGPRPEGKTLDRKNPLGHYEPGNVRWATSEEQTANRLPRGYWSSS